MWMVIGVVITVVTMLCGTKIMIECRRERRRELRDQQRMQTSVSLPGGSKLAGIDTDGATTVGKKHNAALICLARRRCDVLYAMLRNGTHYRHPEPAPAAAAA
ncbi:hypothetical protein GCM10010269_45030 [Streptomyces humidus]|uniref:Uncharacterized protein n=1 Tax=Streptomyces humidus TaxID=52259 RepID=A0A918FZ71_9ACTN|nr:hypothetical protein GCM10010269_45030 [Streptomyces humidus]